MMNIRSLPLLCTIGLYLAVDLCANPSDGKILQGDAQFNTSENLLTIQAQDKTTVEWSSFSNDAEESIYISLPSSSDVFYIHASEDSKVLGKITSNGSIVFLSPKGITVGNKGRIECSQIHLEGDNVHFAGSIQALANPLFRDKGGQVTITGNNILLASSSWIDASGKDGGGKICIGGGWQGKDSAIKNAQVTKVEAGSTLLASALCSGDGGTVVLWSEESTIFAGSIFACGSGEQGAGGSVEVSSKGYLDANEGRFDVRSENGPSGSILLDPLTITINAAGPNVCGNSGGNLDMTFSTQLNNATTTPACATTPPASMANSIITNTALQSFLTLNANVTLAAVNSITVNAAVASSANGVTLTLNAPTVDLNNNISLTGTSSVLQGTNVAVVNVTSPSSTFIFPGIIQDAVSIVEAGGTINLLSNTYAPQQVNITKALTLSGLGNTYNGATGTTITSIDPTISAQRNYSFTFKDVFNQNYTYYPVILVQSPATGVTIQNLTVDGANLATAGAPANPLITGIAFYNASGTISSAYVKRVRAGPTGGGDLNTNSIFIATDTGSTTITIQNSFVDTFQRRAIYVTGVPKMTTGSIAMTITNNIVTGTPAPTVVQAAPNGIEALSSSMFPGTVSGTVSFNTVTGCSDVPSGYDAGGLIFFNSGSLLISHNIVDNNDTGMDVQGSGVAASGPGNPGITIANNSFQNNNEYALYLQDNLLGTVAVLNNTFTDNVAALTGGVSAVYVQDSANNAYIFTTNTFHEPVFAMDIEGDGGGSGPLVTMVDNTFDPT